MSTVMGIFSGRMKGDGCEYRPSAGSVALISGPNCDDENGYLYLEAEILWVDDLFIVYRRPGYWPIVNKWCHIRVKPVGETP